MNKLIPFRILIMDDHKLFAVSLKELLQSIFPKAIIDTCGSVADAQVRLDSQRYHFLLADILLSNTEELRTLQFIQACRKKLPDLSIIVVSSIQHTKIVQDFLKSGIKGYLSKAIDRSELEMAMEKATTGELYISADIISKLAVEVVSPNLQMLTRREMEVLQLISKGYTVKKIAEELFLSQYTVMNHRQNLMKKLKLHSAPELVKYAFENYVNLH